MRFVFTFSLLLSMLPFASASVTNSASSVSLADVTTAYNLCNEGDTLAIPAGTATWASALLVGKGISIIGAGTNDTIISRAGQVFDINGQTINHAPVRIAHMKLDINGYYGGGNYPIGVLTTYASTNYWLRSLRIDHVYFNTAQYAINTVGVCLWGVIDHCYFYNCCNSIGIDGGSAIWEFPITAGTTNALVIEDCTFVVDDGVNSITGWSEQESIYSGHGVRFVVRNNVFDWSAYTGNGLPYENHGKGGIIENDPPVDSDLRGPPIFEVYSNTMSVYKTYRHMNIRGGSGLVWNNTLTSLDGPAPIINVTEDNYDPYGWSGIDQVENLFVWGNTANGSPISDVSLQVQTPTNQIILNRDYFMHAPDDHSGKITWSDWPGSHNAVFNAGVAQAYYPYTPLVYPHPIVTAQDGPAPTPPSTSARWLPFFIGRKP